MRGSTKNNLIYCLMIWVMGLTFLASQAFADMEEVLLSGKKSRGPVTFEHESHMGEYECLDCHHVIENGENVLDEADLEEGDPGLLCGSCHNDTSRIKKREAFHYQCIGCHDSLKAEQGQTGPTLCGECHVLEKD